MTTLSPVNRIHYGGRLLVTRDVQDWISTGVEPYATEPNPNTLGHDYRQHHIAVLVTEHLAGGQCDTCDDNQQLNQEIYKNPGCGERIESLWHRNGTSKIFCITDDWGRPHAHITVLFTSEY